MKTVTKFLKNENGAALAEYAILVAFIAVVCVAAVTLLGGNVSKVLDSGAKQFPATP